MKARANFFLFQTDFRNRLFLLLAFGAAVISGISAPAFCGDTLSQSPEIISKGKGVFENHTCSACHSIGGGIKTGPDLNGVLKQRSLPWLRKWIKSPDAVFASSDPVAAEFKAKIAKSEPGYSIRMPTLGLTDEDVDAVLAYIKSQSR